MENENSLIDWDKCRRCGGNYIEVDSASCLSCHKKEKLTGERQ